MEVDDIEEKERSETNFRIQTLFLIARGLFCSTLLYRRLFHTVEPLIRNETRLPVVVG